MDKQTNKQKRQTNKQTNKEKRQTNKQTNSRETVQKTIHFNLKLVLNIEPTGSEQLLGCFQFSFEQL